MYAKFQAICALLLVAAGCSLAMKRLVHPEHSMDQKSIGTRDLYGGAYVHHKRDNSGKEDDTLRTSLIIVFTVGITVGLLLIMIVCAVCMLHRARRGNFCCLKPKIQYPRLSANLVSDSSEDEQEQPSPPQYDTAYLVNESPPVYEDALQDLVIATGIRTSEMQLPPYPLNCSHLSESQTASNEEERMPITVGVGDTSYVAVISSTAQTSV